MSTGRLLQTRKAALEKGGATMSGRHKKRPGFPGLRDPCHLVIHKNVANFYDGIDDDGNCFSPIRHKHDELLVN